MGCPEAAPSLSLTTHFFASSAEFVDWFWRRHPRNRLTRRRVNRYRELPTARSFPASNCQALRWPADCSNLGVPTRTRVASDMLLGTSMREAHMNKATAITLGICLMIPGIVCAQSGNSSSATKLATGRIRSFDGSTTLVVTSEVNGKRESTTFLLNANTKTVGELTKGADVTLQYRVDGNRNIATVVQAQPPELETLEYAKSMISLDGAARARITTGNNVAVDGSATNHDKFQHDVFLTATLWDANGKSVGTATGRLEDLPAGHRGDYRLAGTVTSPNWVRVSVTISKVTEHVRKEE